MDHPKSVDHQTGPGKNLAHLREQQAQLRRRDVSCDLSEVSYQTEHTDFQNSRHSSLNTEPLTLDAEQIHYAKDQAEDVLQTTDPESALGIFTKDLDIETVDEAPQDGEAGKLAQQLNALVEKAQEVVEANEKQSQVKSRGADKKEEVVTESSSHDQSDVDTKATHTAEVLPGEDVKKQND